MKVHVKLMRPRAERRILARRGCAGKNNGLCEHPAGWTDIVRDR